MIEELLTAVYPNSERVRALTPHLARAGARQEINSEDRVTMWLAQLAVESSDFQAVEENLNYSAERLLEVFQFHFDAQSAAAVEHNPMRIGSIVYANRMGNGDEKSKDGWTFRGRGLVQLTGRDGYTEASAALGLPLVGHPEYAKEPAVASNIAAWFWKSKGCNQLADAKKFDAITRAINGGMNGSAARKAKLKTFQEALCQI